MNNRLATGVSEVTALRRGGPSPTSRAAGLAEAPRHTLTLGAAPWSSLSKRSVVQYPIRLSALAVALQGACLRCYPQWMRWRPDLRVDGVLLATGLWLIVMRTDVAHSGTSQVTTAGRKTRPKG
jgi:hypothetical protein